MIDMEIIQDPVALKALAEKRELMRSAASLALRNGGRHLTRDQLEVAKARAAFPRLQAPLGTGEPQEH